MELSMATGQIQAAYFSRKWERFWYKLGLHTIIPLHLFSPLFSHLLSPFFLLSPTSGLTKTNHVQFLEECMSHTLCHYACHD